MMWGLEVMVYGLGFGASGFGFRVSGIGFRSSGSGLGFRSLGSGLGLRGDLASPESDGERGDRICQLADHLEVCLEALVYLRRGESLFINYQTRPLHAN
jgi:hypothetical protein